MNQGESEELANSSPLLAGNADELQDNTMTYPCSLWRTSPAAYGIMLSLLLLGLVTAICHDLFYSYLDHREIEESGVPQNWAIRIGNTFAYLFKTALVAAVAVAYAQGFWFFVRRKPVEIGSIDNVFGVLSNPLLLFNITFIQKLTLLFGVAGVSWLLPISAVFAPGTLTGYCLPFDLLRICSGYKGEIYSYECQCASPGSFGH